MCKTCGCEALHDHEAKEGPLGAVHAHGIEAARAIEIEEDILSENDRFARQNREIFARHKILALNLVSSPGSGKTTLLAATLRAKRFKAAVIEGDQSTELDAARIRETGAPVIQINTGQGCHLEGRMVGHAMLDLNIPTGEHDGSVVFIENVGNLVCPAAYDLGEAAKVVLLSVTEGDDKPLKYPDMFAASELMIVTKMDLLPHVSFDVERCVAYAKKINPKIQVLKLSSTTGEGMEDWFVWLNAKRAG